MLIDYSANLHGRRSLTGYLFTIFRNVINWQASLQSVVALSTIQSNAEQMALGGLAELERSWKM